ncbi:hypothetical protein [Nostoc sp. WHI]|uniref:hypothetical protein n=1 Tax=Nostoc sp. WHI TaxID=2650611 RepID=UPI0018C85A4E|nr:hypothetical protein [Nostoc sp. WHI]
MPATNSIAINCDRIRVTCRCNPDLTPWGKGDRSIHSPVTDYFTGESRPCADFAYVE